MNTEIKMKFIDVIDCKQIDKEILKEIFEIVAPIEEETGTDLCNIDIERYPEIVAKSHTFKRFGKYASIYHKLLDYRKFCFGMGLGDTERFLRSIGKFKRAKTVDELYEEYKKISVPVAFNFKTPGELYDVLANILEPDIKHDSVTYNDLVLLYLMFVFLGFDEEEIAMVERVDVVENLDGSVCICPDGKNIVVYDEIARIALKVRDSRTILFNHGTWGVREVDLDTSYLFGFLEDGTATSLMKRLKKINNRYCKICENFSKNEYPPVMYIRFKGTIYAMCLDSKSSGVVAKDKESVVLLYGEHSGRENLSNSMSIAEAYNTYIDTYDYLEKNNWPH